MRQLRLVESSATGLAFNPLPDRRFARFICIGKRTNRAILMKFQDDLFPPSSLISSRYKRLFLPKCKGKMCTFSLIPHIVGDNPVIS